MFPHFNSHAHVERDRCWGNIDFGIKISTHTLTWSVTGSCVRFTDITQISTHTLTWSVTRTWKEFDFTLNISTHTLTWSVTFELSYQSVLCAISTHTLTWSVTTPNGLSFLPSKYFNSHAHVERDITKLSIFFAVSQFQLTRSRGA